MPGRDTGRIAQYKLAIVPDYGCPGMSNDPKHAEMHVETDVLIIGSGGAGMYAAIEAARAGCSVFLLDRSLIGRGGATVMAQMTVAVALGSRDAGSLELSLQRHARGRARALRRAAGAAAVRGRPGLHPRDGANGASAGRARTAASRKPSRPAMTGRAASMWIFSIPARRCRRRYARWSRAPRSSARPATS